MIFLSSQFVSYLKFRSSEAVSETHDQTRSYLGFLQIHCYFFLITCVFLFSFQDKSYVFSSPWLSSDALKYLPVFLYLGIEAGTLYFV